MLYIHVTLSHSDMFTSRVGLTGISCTHYHNTKIQIQYNLKQTKLSWIYATLYCRHVHLARWHKFIVASPELAAPMEANSAKAKAAKKDQSSSGYRRKTYTHMYK
jgi:hypothetical protein